MRNTREKGKKGRGKGRNEAPASTFGIGFRTALDEAVGVRGKLAHWLKRVDEEVVRAGGHWIPLPTNERRSNRGGDCCVRSDTHKRGAESVPAGRTKRGSRRRERKQHAESLSFSLCKTRTAETGNKMAPEAV